MGNGRRWEKKVTATIYVGIGPNGDRVGVQIGQGTLEDIANKIAQSTNPRQTPSIVTSDSAGKIIIKIAVPASRFKPVYAFDRPYRRSGATNQRLSIAACTGNQNPSSMSTDKHFESSSDRDCKAVRLSRESA